MLKKILPFFVLVIQFSYSQCTIDDLNLKLMGKQLSEVNNYLYSSTEVSDIRENGSWDGRKIPDIKSNYGYLDEEFSKKSISFKYGLNKCFTNFSSKDKTSYNLKLINNKVYAISIKRKYDFDSEQFKNDFKDVTLIIQKKFNHVSDNKIIQYKFNVSENNVNGEYIATAKSTIYDNLKKYPKIWKVNQVEIINGKDYTTNKLGGYALPPINLFIEIEFTELEGTPLDNRGY